MLYLKFLFRSLCKFQASQVENVGIQNGTFYLSALENFSFVEKLYSFLQVEVMIVVIFLLFCNIRLAEM